jgi:hypothetical protein
MPLIDCRAMARRSPRNEAAMPRLLPSPRARFSRLSFFLSFFLSSFLSFFLSFVLFCVPLATSALPSVFRSCELLVSSEVWRGPVELRKGFSFLLRIVSQFLGRRGVKGRRDFLCLFSPLADTHSGPGGCSRALHSCTPHSLRVALSLVDSVIFYAIRKFHPSGGLCW